MHERPSAKRDMAVKYVGTPYQLNAKSREGRSSIQAQDPSLPSMAIEEQGKPCQMALPLDRSNSNVFCETEKGSEGEVSSTLGWMQLWSECPDAY